MHFTHRAALVTHTTTGIALFASVLGFLGVYRPEGFAGLPPGLVLGTQLVCLGTGLVAARGRVVEGLRANWALVLLIAWLALTLIWAHDPVIATQRWLLVTIPAILLSVSAYLDPRPDRTLVRLTGLFAGIAVASLIWSFLAYAYGDVVADAFTYRYLIMDVGAWRLGVSEGGRQYFDIGLYVPRFSGITSNPNSASLFAALALVALAAHVKLTSGSRDRWVLTLTVLVAVMVVGSMSRASIVAAIVGLVVVVLLRLRWIVSARLIALAMPLLAGLLYLFVALADSSSVPGNAEVFELRERAEVWAAAFRAATLIWPRGVGFGMSEEAVFLPMGFQAAAHSVPISILLEGGVIGLGLALLVWFWPVVALTRSEITQSPATVAVVALLVAIFVHQIVDSAVFRYHWAHFVFVYLLGAGARLAAPDAPAINGQPTRD